MITERIKHKIDNKTKPLGSLGELEQLALKICQIQSTLSPSLRNPHLFVFAGDHGIANSGVSAYPQEVTHQMVFNFLSGGAAINVFTKQHGIKLEVVDTGVNYVFDSEVVQSDFKIAFGTRNFLEENAMTNDQLGNCLANGEKIVDQAFIEGCNIIGFGEMGIGNTSSASMLMHKLLELPIEDCIGRGTGLEDKQLQLKIKLLKQASKKHTASTPLEVLQTFGGFEIATMAGSMIAASKRGMIVLVDGFIATAAYLAAFKLNPEIKKNAIFCHQSNEQGHKVLLQKLNANPILKMELRLGEGTGCALAYPIIQSAVNFMNEMASFESAGVANKT